MLDEQNAAGGGQVGARFGVYKDKGQRMRERREVVGLTQRQLGAKIGCSGQTISNWEKGLYWDAIPMRQFAFLTRALNTTKKWLITGQGESSAVSPVASQWRMQQELPSHVQKEIADYVEFQYYRHVT